MFTKTNALLDIKNEDKELNLYPNLKINYLFNFLNSFWIASSEFNEECKDIKWTSIPIPHPKTGAKNSHLNPFNTNVKIVTAENIKYIAKWILNPLLLSTLFLQVHITLYLTVIS